MDYGLVAARIVEVEALIRWQHEKRGLLQPDAFIGLTEETGLIVPIGQWVLTEACQQAARWHKHGHRLDIAVNFSLSNPYVIVGLLLPNDHRLILASHAVPSPARVFARTP